MKLLIGILVAVSLIVTGVTALKVNAQPNISNDPSSYAFGILEESLSYSTNLDYFTVTNNSGYPVNITIGGSDMTGGVTWILADDAEPGTNRYGLKAGLAVSGSYDIIVKKTGSFNPLVSGLAASDTREWGLQLLAPTSFTDGVAKEGTVTLTATQA